jgi:asparagine synthase (glutamine-hydrolysing)
LWDASGRYCLVYNGEVYNFRELRDELEQHGVAFRTASDTEVILQCFIHDGPHKALAKFSGMFALIFYDRTERRVHAARDRYGIKPLVVYRDEGRVVFASEVKSMSPWIDLRPNGLQMTRYLMDYGAPTQNEGFFERVEMVPPGSLISIEVGAPPTSTRFAELGDHVSADKMEHFRSLSPEQAIDHVDDLLQRSVRRMLFADAPVGALCSGGVDSSLLMAIAARFHNNLAIFHADVVGRESEYEAASTLARHLKLDLLTVKVRDEDFIELAPDVMYHYEYPFSGHPHSIPFLMVSRLVKEHNVKAVLTGEGSDENFLGYTYLPYEPLWKYYARQIGRIGSLVQRVPVIGDKLWPASSNPDLIADMLGQFSMSSETRRTHQLYAENAHRPIDSNVRTLDLLEYHLRTLLHRNDAMGMATSIEARFPFLDEELVDAACNFPYHYKIRFSPAVWEKEHPLLRDKWVVRAVADRYMPDELSKRRKWGFNVSAFQRMRIDGEFFADSFVAEHFRLTQAQMKYFLEQADQRLTTKIMMLESWGQLFFQGTGTEDLQARFRRYATVTPQS